jgi:hypothetical protein
MLKLHAELDEAPAVAVHKVKTNKINATKVAVRFIISDK